MKARHPARERLYHKWAVSVAPGTDSSVFDSALDILRARVQGALTAAGCDFAALQRATKCRDTPMLLVALQELIDDQQAVERGAGLYASLGDRSHDRRRRTLELTNDEHVAVLEFLENLRNAHKKR